MKEPHRQDEEISLIVSTSIQQLYLHGQRVENLRAGDSNVSFPPTYIIIMIPFNKGGRGRESLLRNGAGHQELGPAS